MTREEAIAELKYSIELTHFNPLTGETSEWLNEEDQRYVDACNMAIKALEQELCDDAISRADVKKYLSAPDANGERVIYEDDLDLLPPVTPQPKMGHWIRYKNREDSYYHIKCSECGQFWSVDGHAQTFKYCFNCGQQMIKEVKE